VRQSFGISAPHIAVRTRLPWWGRSLILLALVALVAAVWWWAFDLRGLVGGPNRRDLEARVQSLEADVARYRSEAAELRGRNSQLESDLAMTRGAQEALSRQATDLAGENAQVKEELAFLQKLFADSNKPGGLTIPRLTLERQDDETWRYGVLVVRGGAPGEDYRGSVVLQATVAPSDPEQSAVRTLILPEDQPDTAAALQLKFKYYQRIEGTLRVPAGARVTALTARVYEEGDTTPRATRTLSNP
jgi:FtsZ-binding cell division protein ZapB